VNPPPQPKAILAGLTVAILFGAVCLFFALWNPADALIPAVTFVIVTIGILTRRRWRTYA
jgi:hypothetical protein